MSMVWFGWLLVQLINLQISLISIQSFFPSHLYDRNNWPGQFTNSSTNRGAITNPNLFPPPYIAFLQHPGYLIFGIQTYLKNFGHPLFKCSCLFKMQSYDTKKTRAQPSLAGKEWVELGVGEGGGDKLTNKGLRPLLADTPA